MVNAQIDALFLSVVALAVVARRARKVAAGCPTYTSTRSVQKKSFDEAVLLGLASDGGLFVPSRVPVAPWKQWSALSFPALAFAVARQFIPESVASPAELDAIVKASYANGKWRSDKITPVRQVGDIQVLELFHGPTFAFKDVALQFLGNLFAHLLSRKQGDEAKITVLGATSGDTGSSAIHGLMGKRGVECVMLFPEGGVSPIQERQMTTVADANVHCVAVRGSFDDAQDIVKAAFQDEPFRARYRLAAVNSINWARIMVQITYYFFAYFELKRAGKSTDNLVFVVPTGNFGDILAGFYAKRMGLPIERLIVATNENDILDRFFRTGTYSRAATVAATITPSMDIGVSSNFERFLYHMHNNDAAQTASLMRQFDTSKQFTVTPEILKRCQAEMGSFAVKDEGIRACILRVHEKDGYVLDPHTAVGVQAAYLLRQQGALTAKHQVVCLATAHWAKFMPVVQKTLGKQPHDFPAELKALENMPTRKDVVAATPAAVKALIAEKLGS